MGWKRREDLAGQVFHNLTAVECVGVSPGRVALWRCMCVCGTERIVAAVHLKQGGVKSCGGQNCVTPGGHYQRTYDRPGTWAHPLYVTWQGMMQRCYNEKHEHYQNYGGRGIAVCDEWHDPWKFFEDMGPKPTPQHTLERRDNDVGYCKDNCYYADRQAQSRNRRNNVLIEYDGRVQCLTAWAEELGINEGTLRERYVKLEWSAVDALTRPIRRKKTGG